MIFYKNSLRSIRPTAQLRNELNVDSMGLHATISTLHEGNEYRLQQSFPRIRDTFEGADIDILRWIPGVLDITDCLIKYNIMLWKFVSNIAATGEVNMEHEDGKYARERYLATRSSPSILEEKGVCWIPNPAAALQDTLQAGIRRYLTYKWSSNRTRADRKLGTMGKVRPRALR